MKFHTLGDDGLPVIIMLPGSFSPGKSLSYLYDDLKNSFRTIIVDYNGHYNDSTFTTRQGEAKEIADYIKKNSISNIKMIYGQSMGGEVSIELLRQLLKAGVNVEKLLVDGAPCIRLGKFYKRFMYLKFKTMISMIKERNIEDVINWKFLNQFSNGDTDFLRPMLEAVKDISSVISKESIYNENECCYTFDFPAFDRDIQRRMYFLYAGEEKAYKTCIKGVKNSYPDAHYKVVSGYGHMTYSIRCKDEYLKMLKAICKTGQ